MDEIIELIVTFAPFVLVGGMVWMVFRAWANWMSALPYVVSDDTDTSQNAHRLSVTKNWWWPEDPASPLHHQDH